MVSNYMNLHQVTFCDQIYSLTNGQFNFISTNPISSFRMDLGYQNMDQSREYIVASYESDNNLRNALKLCEEADVLIIGNVEKHFRIKPNKKQVVFYYSERLFKNDRDLLRNIVRYIKYSLRHHKYKNSFLLCASAYACKDYQITGNFKGRSFKWGYFPCIKKYSIDDIIKQKKNHPPRIVWVGRLINWKHPELAIQVADHLRKKNIIFEMEIIGSGELEGSLKELITNQKLESCVKLLGSLRQDEIRQHMEKANVFLFTSDENEGWGAVVNEAMNSACAIIACVEAGSVPYLVDDECGKVFHKWDISALFSFCEGMLLDLDLTTMMGIASYNKIINIWNGEIAAKRLMKMIKAIQLSNTLIFENGPCSPA